MGGSIEHHGTIYKQITPEQIFIAIPRLKRQTTTITLHELDDDKNPCLNQLIRDAFKKFNIKVDFSYHSTYKDFWSRFLNHDMDGYIDSYVFQNRESLRIFNFFSEHADNDANLTGHSVSDLIDKALSSSNSFVLLNRSKYYTMLNEYLTSNAIVIPIYYMNHVLVIRKCMLNEIKKTKVNPFLILPSLSRKDCHGFTKTS
jgi:ABC-type oligopeptide transport system substrate-binding subunit